MATPRPSDIHRVSKNGGTEWLTQAGFRNDVNFPIQQADEFRFEAGNIQQRSAGLEQHEQIHIAGSSFLATSGRPKQTYTPRAVCLSSPQDLSTKRVYLSSNGHSRNLRSRFPCSHWCCLSFGIAGHGRRLPV